MTTLAEELRALTEAASATKAEKEKALRLEKIQQAANYVIQKIPEILREAAKCGHNEVCVHRIDHLDIPVFSGEPIDPQRFSGPTKLIYEWLLAQPGLTPTIVNGPLYYREEMVPPNRFSISVRW